VTTIAKELAYCTTELITAVKSFIIQASGLSLPRQQQKGADDELFCKSIFVFGERGMLRGRERAKEGRSK